MLKLRIRADLKCKKHPRFDPYKHGRGGVRGGCAVCESLCDLWAAGERLTASARLFGSQPAGKDRGGAAIARDELCGIAHDIEADRANGPLTPASRSLLVAPGAIGGHPARKKEPPT
jgi:hypothetical protein